MRQYLNLSQPQSNRLLLTIIVAVCLLAPLALSRAESPRNFLLYHFGAVGLIACFVAALHFVNKYQLDAPLSWPSLLLLLCTLITFSLLLQLLDTTFVTDILAILHRRFREPYWQALGLLLAFVIYLPILYDSFRHCLRDRSHADIAVCAALFLIVFLLYLPFGFDSIAHWENWIYRAHLEGRFSASVTFELTTRFWVAVPHKLASIISPDSFVGFHLTHLLILWGKLVLLYGILRKLSLTRLHAFLATMLFLFYPVNSDLISLRSLPNQFSAMSLLAAGYLILDFRSNPSRRKLLGIWLALGFNVTTNETAYALILTVPLLWLLKRRPIDRTTLNLSAIWFLAPLAKVAYLALLAGKSLTFYNSYVFAGEWTPAAHSFAPVLSRLVDVYRHTFDDGWQTALLQLSQSDWLAMTAVMLALIAGTAVLLTRREPCNFALSSRQLYLGLIGGLLLVVPSVGVLIWLEQYSGDLWRTYFYVPIGASIALFSLIALLTAPIKRIKLRNAAIVSLTLATCLPGIARLYEQNARLVTRANNKAILLSNLLHVVPHIEQDTTVLLLTDLSDQDLHATDYYELRYSRELDDSILYVLYGDGVGLTSHFCLIIDPCTHLRLISDPASPDWSAEMLQRTLFLRINHDLTIDLIEDPIAFLNLDINIHYDASQLYDPDAPLPARAQTMLGRQF